MSVHFDFKKKKKTEDTLYLLLKTATELWFPDLLTQKQRGKKKETKIIIFRHTMMSALLHNTEVK